MADAGPSNSVTVKTNGAPAPGAATAALATVAAAAAAAVSPQKEASLASLAERLGYPMIQENGQRRLGPPPDWEGPPPPRGCEVFVGKIPRDCFEDELVPVFQKVGRIFEIRMMMDFNGANRGYCFVGYTNRSDAKRAVRELNDHEIRERRYLGVCLSVDNCRLFVGGIPLDKQRTEIIEEMRKVTEGVVDAIVYPSVADKTKNRGFTFVEFESHRAAAMARRKLLPGRIQLWGQPIAVDWAEPEQEVDEEVMSKVKILYVRNLMLSTAEQTIESACNQAADKEGAVERVKKLKDYAFVHFRERSDALRVMNALNGTDIDGSTIEVVLAKPVSKDSAMANLHSPPAKATAVVTYPTVQGHQYVTGHDLYSTSAAAANGFVTGVANIRGVAGQRGGPVSPRGPFPGRGRSAAGSRGAGGVSRVYAQRNAYRGQHFETDRVYDIHPGMELIPIHPVSLKPVQHKPATQLLDEYCQKNGWETPVFQLHSTIGRDGTGDIQLFLYKVFIPSLSQSWFTPLRLTRNIEEAKKIAAEHVLMHVGTPVEAVYQFPYPPPLHAGYHSY